LYYLILYKNYNPREMILRSLDLSHQGESNQKKIIEIKLLVTKLIDLECLYYLL